MRVQELVTSYPRLYHMAEDGSWPSIRRHGLLSTRALLDLFEVEGAQRRTLLSRRRPASVTITKPGRGTAVVRDNIPLSDRKLQRCLVGMQPQQWYRLLNNMVFFWVREERLTGLLSARAYRTRPHTILVVDTERLVNAHLRRIRLSPINSGSTAYRGAPRGDFTFRPIARYPFTERRRARGLDAVVELAVGGAVPDISEHVVRVERRQGSRRLEQLWP